MRGAWRDKSYVIRNPTPGASLSGPIAGDSTPDHSILAAYLIGIALGMVAGSLVLYAVIPYLPFAAGR